MTTFMAKPQTIERKWYVIDAADQVVGRLAVTIANILRGKHRPEYTAIHEAQTNQIRQLLSPWQLAEYDQYRIERDAKMKKKDKTPGF